MKNKFILISIFSVLILLMLVGFNKKKGTAEFIEIYRTNEYTISSNRESPTSAWIKWQYPTTIVKTKSGKYVETGGKMLMQLWKCSCYSRTYDITSLIEYDRHGDVVNSSRIGAYFEPVVPETVGEVVFNHICANDDQSYYSDWSDLDSSAVIDTTAEVSVDASIDASTYQGGK